jgi:serine/threonine protein kinase
MNKIGKYEIRSELGRGAMGIVYLGYDPVIERPVAIKTMNAEAFEEEEQKQRFLREARSAGAMQHPNIVTIYEMGMEGNTPYIAMEYVEGQDLTQLIKKGEPRSLEDKLAIMAQLCDALYFAHKKEVIHRDIKPGNIRILTDGTVKIMDFGIAKKQDSDFTRTGLVVGTLSYMSPEQVQGKPLDPRSDQFSAGVVFYQMLTGKKPFGGDNLTNVIYQIISFNVNTLELPGTPTVMKKIVQKMMNPDPEKRFRTCGEVATLLRQELQYLQGEGEAPTVLLDAEDHSVPPIPPLVNDSPTGQAQVPPLPDDVSTRQEPLMAAPEPVKKKNPLPIVLGILLFVAILGVGGVLGYRKFIQPRQTAQLTDNSNSEKENPTNTLGEEMPSGEEQAAEAESGIQTESSNSATSISAQTNGKSQKDMKNIQPATVQASPETQKQNGGSNSTIQTMTKTTKNPTPVPKKKETAPKQLIPTPNKTNETEIAGPEKVFKKEGQGLQILALHKVFAEYQPRIEKFKARVLNMPLGQRKAMFSREINMGRLSLGNNNKIPAAFHFYKSVILQPRNKDGYAWLVATLVDVKAYEDARRVVKKAAEEGVSVSEMNTNMRFKIAYQKLQMH